MMICDIQDGLVDFVSQTNCNVVYVYVRLESASVIEFAFNNPRHVSYQIGKRSNLCKCLIAEDRFLFDLVLSNIYDETPEGHLYKMYHFLHRENFPVLKIVAESVQTINRNFNE